MKTAMHTLFAASVVAVFAVGACTTEYLPPPSNGELAVVPQHEIGPLVAGALCELEQQCGGDDFASVEACTSATAVNVADAVDAEDCQDGAWLSRIASCLDAISRQSCGAEVDPGLIAACNEDLMCLQPTSGTSRPAGTDGKRPSEDHDTFPRGE
jgi:hypothetical protein